MSAIQLKSQELHIRIVMVKFFESQLKLIIRIFGVEGNNNVFLILISTKLFFCLHSLSKVLDIALNIYQLYIKVF